QSHLVSRATCTPANFVLDAGIAEIFESVRFYPRLQTIGPIGLAGHLPELRHVEHRRPPARLVHTNIGVVIDRLLPKHVEWARSTRWVPTSASDSPCCVTSKNHAGRKLGTPATCFMMWCTLATSLRVRCACLKRDRRTRPGHCAASASDGK